MTEIGTATVKVRLDWAGVATDLRSLADKIDPEPATGETVETADHEWVSIPVPADDATVEVVARTLHDRVCERPRKCGFGTPERLHQIHHRDAFFGEARAVLAALAAMGGEG